MDKKLSDNDIVKALDKTKQELANISPEDDDYDKLLTVKTIVDYCIDLIHRLQGENETQRKIIEYQDGLPDLVEQQKAEIERLTDEKEEIRLFNLAIQNGEVDMRIESEMAKSFYNSIVQVFEQNGAKNFFTTTVDIDGKKGRYAFTIEKVGGQTVAEKLAEQKAEIERLTEEIATAKQELVNEQRYYENAYSRACQLETQNAELQKKVENQKAVIVGQAKRIEKEKAENKRLYNEFVRLDDFCATKGCICCICEKKKTCGECAKCGSLATEKCKGFKIDVSKYTRAIERADKLQKQIDQLNALKAENTELHKEHTALIAGSILEKQDIVKDTAKEIVTEIDDLTLCIIGGSNEFEKGYFQAITDMKTAVKDLLKEKIRRASNE